MMRSRIYRTASLMVGALMAGALLLGTVSCTTLRLPADPGREAFKETDRPPSGWIGNDPTAIAQDLYSGRDVGAGKYAEELVAVRSDAEQPVLLFARLNITDDSVRGIRYRLEFAPRGDQWELVWVGTQVTCWPGRGHRNWSTQRCT
ncbi:MAG: hypothetical protein AAFY20_00230 [Cyanobacteria bacterium J06639_14]